MDENGTSKNLPAEGKKDERGRRQPLRIHELLGIPKSSGKSQNGNASTMQSQRSQPVLVKDLFKSTSSCKKPYPSERRQTMANGKASNARRQLYDLSIRATPENAFSITAGLPESSKGITAGLHGNAGSKAESRSAQLLGVSKSEGKHIMNGPGFRQPERVKDFMESWEKSQTVKRQARKSVIGDLRTKNVRRKLYNVPSPAAAPQIAQKSLVPSRLQNQKYSTAVQSKSVKGDQKKSSQSQPRSSLLPPNSIRDKHMNRQQNDTIKEESPASLLNESKERNSEKTLPNNKRVSPEKKFDIEKSVESRKNRSLPSNEPEERSVSDDEKIDEAAPQRPTVIMAATSNRKISHEKNFTRSPSPKSSDGKNSPFTLSRPPFKELNLKSSFPKHRLDAATSSIEDLLGNSRPDGGESSIGNLPCNSFLEQLLTTKNSQVNVDKQTVRWMHANLKLVIQSTEENLFAMKKMLRALDDLVDDDSSVSEIPTAPSHDDEEIHSAARIEEKISEKIDDPPELPVIVVNQFFDDSEKIDKDLRRHGREPDDEENKENVFVADFKTTVEKGGRRRSARLVALEIGRSPKNLDDSFSAIERELNIVHEKSKAATPRIATPRERKKIDPRSRRSMREYMALKSMVNCLQTPDVKGAPTPKGGTKELSNQIRAKRSISRTLMNELDDLYADSPQ